MPELTFLLLADIEVKDEDSLLGLCDEEILWLDVPMADSLIVKVAYALHHLSKYLTSHLLGVVPVDLACQVVEYFHSIHILHD